MKKPIVVNIKKYDSTKVPYQANFEPNVCVPEIELVHLFYRTFGCFGSPFITVYNSDVVFGTPMTHGDGVYEYDI